MYGLSIGMFTFDLGLQRSRPTSCISDCEYISKTVPDSANNYYCLQNVSLSGFAVVVYAHQNIIH